MKQIKSKIFDRRNHIGAFGKGNIFTSMHVTTWDSAKSEIPWVQEVGLVEIRKLDWCKIFK